MKIAGVAIVKNEASYLSEWILYHISIGMDHFFIYDNFSSDDTNSILAPYIQAGVVTLIHWPLTRSQDDAYAHAFATQAASFDWVACFDVDEFFLLKKHDSLKSFLSEFSEYEQVIVPWRFFGHGGHLTRPSGLVTENFITCDDKLHTHTKFFIKPSAVADAGVHVCTTKNKLTVNERKQILDEGRFHSNHTSDLIQLNHYYTRSYEEYERKIMRGQADGRDLKKLESFKYYEFKSLDYSLAHYSTRLKSKLQLISALSAYTPINSGFFSDLFLPNDNLPIKYLIRDVIETFAKSEAGIIEKHLKYNFGSILRAKDNCNDEVVNFLHTLPEKITNAPLNDEVFSKSEYAEYGCPFVTGTIVSVADQEPVTFQVTGRDWLGNIKSRSVTFTIPAKGTWCYAVSIGRTFLKVEDTFVKLSENSSAKVDFRLNLIW